MFLNKIKRLRSCVLIFPVLLALSACNDSKDDQGATKPDVSNKPVMRCAP
ncbi:hypothetical protein L289_0699 [Acinetobacter gerneri DSM 14967 = CIP 107464 = MTCC 9824]|nr:hypothetical protein L289_0699 [Acinetobacter gerneri DSM 14967 = CIP 107464 = MTCC 9824]